MASSAQDDRLAASLNAVRRLVEFLHSSSRAIERETGLSNAQLHLLRLLATRDGRTIGELASDAHVHQSTASLLAGRLEAAGCIRRQRSTRDQRRVHLYVTPAGRRLAARGARTASEQLASGLERMSRGDRDALWRGLQALEGALGIQDRVPTMLFAAVRPAIPGRAASGRRDPARRRRLRNGGA